MDDLQIDEDAVEAKASNKRRKRIRALIIGSLASGGAFQLNGWQAQAHGNRSTKSAIGEFQDVVRVQPVSVSAAEQQRIKAKKAKAVIIAPKAKAVKKD